MIYLTDVFCCCCEIKIEEFSWSYCNKLVFAVRWAGCETPKVFLNTQFHKHLKVPCKMFNVLFMWISCTYWSALKLSGVFFCSVFLIFTMITKKPFSACFVFVVFVCFCSLYSWLPQMKYKCLSLLMVQQNDLLLVQTLVNMVTRGSRGSRIQRVKLQM